MSQINNKFLAQIPANTLKGNNTGITANVTDLTTSQVQTMLSIPTASSPLAIGSGGTGQTTQQTALNAIAGSVTSGSYLRGNGTNILMSAIQVADVPTLNQNTTGTASNITASSNSTLTTLSVLSLPGAQVTGNIAGNAANITGTSNSTLTTLSSLALPASQLTGTIAAAQFPALSGDITTSAGSLVTTLATVNSNVGSFGSSTSIPNFTVNGKGLVTAAGSNVVIAPAGTLSGTTLNSTVVTSSLTSLGTQSIALNMGSHRITSVTDPASAQDAATKNYVDNAVAGINPAVAVQAATTSASNTSSYTYNNGVSGISATLTGPVNTALTVDGYTFTATGQRLLVKNDTQSPSGAFNGVYYVTQLQTGVLPLILTRALDYDQPSDINNTGAIPVINGTVNGTTQWVLTSLVNTVGTDPLTFAQFAKNPSTLVTLSGTETLSNKTFSDAITMTEISTPSNPAASNNKIYFKSDNKAYILDSSGNESILSSTVPSAIWSGYHNTTVQTNSWLTTTASYVDFTNNDSNVSLVSSNTQNFGTVTGYGASSGASALPGIVFTPTSTGLYFIRASFNANSINGSEMDVRLWDGTTVIDSATSLVIASGSEIFNPVELSGVYNITSLAPVTLSIQGASSVGTSYLISNAISNYRLIDWSIFQISGNASTNTPKFNIAHARIDNTGAITYQNSTLGNWISSVTNSTTGQYDIVFNGGMFNVAPTCTVTIADGSNVNRCIAVNATPTTTTLSVFTQSPGGTPINLNFNIHAMG